MLIMTGLLTLGITVFAGGYLFGSSRVPNRVPLPPVTDAEPSVAPIQIGSEPTGLPVAPSVKPERIVIPAEWRQYSAYDPDYKIEVRLRLPPGYSFRFTGSESTIQDDAEATELWDVKTSVFSGWDMTCDRNIATNDAENCCTDGAVNYYNGGSRRAWYARYLNGDFFCNVPKAKMGSVMGVTERTAGAFTYLEIRTDIGGDGNTETHYVAAKGDTAYMIRPTSNDAMSAKAKLPEYMGMILSTVSSVRR